MDDSENLYPERFLFADPYYGEYSIWMTKDYSGIYILYYEEETKEYHGWDKLEERLRFLEEDKELIPLVQEIRKKVYQHKPKSQCSGNREEI